MSAPLDTFTVSVLEARNLFGTDKSGNSDAYVQLRSTFNKQTFKTKVVKKSNAPKWSQSFGFFTSKAEGEVHLRILDKVFIGKDEVLGELSLKLDDYIDGTEHTKWFPLASENKKKKSGEKPGEIQLRLHFSGTPVPASPKPVASKEEAKPVEKKEEAPPAAVSGSTGGDGKNIEDKYTLGKIVGRGAFSVVKEGIRKASGKKYAVKCISKKLIDKKELALLEREIDIMKKLQHPNIIQLMEVIDSPDTLYLILEFISGGELFDAIVNKGSYTEEQTAKIVKQILEAVQYIHAHGIAHRDLKPENLLLSGEEGKEEFVKIADFGLSKDFGAEQLQTSCGTPDYVAPEVLMGDPYDMSVDIWSIGVITYVLLCGFPPFYGETQKELFENIMNGNYDFPDPEWRDVSPEAKNFIKKILVVNPEERYTADACLADPWIKDLTNRNKDLKRLQSFSVKKFKEYTQNRKDQAGQGGQGMSKTDN